MPAHRCAFRVYYEDTDAGGVMYHAQYLAFAERGRSEALREAGVPAMALLERHGIAFVVRRLGAEYLRPLRLDALVTVETVLAERRAASLRLRQTLSTQTLSTQTLSTETPSAGNVVAAVLDVTVATVRLADLRPVRLPEPWATVLDGLAG